MLALEVRLSDLPDTAKSCVQSPAPQMKGKGEHAVGLVSAGDKHLTCAASCCLYTVPASVPLTCLWAALLELRAFSEMPLPEEQV